MSSTTAANARQPSLGGLRRVMLSIMPVTAAVQVLSFFSSVAMASLLGATRDTDAYYLALLVPSITSGVLLTGLRQGSIPGLTDLRNSSEEDFRRSASSLMMAAAVVSLAAAAVITLIAVVVMQVTLGNWEPKYVDRACTYAVMLIPYTVGGALLGAMGATLAVLGSFRAAIGVSAAEPALKIALILLLPELGGFSLVLGNLGGQAISLVLLMAFLLRIGFRFKFGVKVRSPFVKRVLLVSAPLVIGQSVIQMNPLVDRGVAASLGSGSVTALELASRLIVPPTVLLSSAMLTPLVATWAAQKDAGGWGSLRGSFTSVVDLVMVVSCLILAIGIPLSHELVAFMYGGRAFSPHAVSQTATAFRVLLMSLPLGLVLIPCSTMFVVAEQTTFPMKIAFGNVILNTALSIPLAALVGLWGVAMGTVITYAVFVTVYLVEIHRRFAVIDVRSLGKTLLVTIAAGLLGGSFAWLASSELQGLESPRDWAALAISCAVGLAACGVPLFAYVRRHRVAFRPGELT